MSIHHLALGHKCNNLREHLYRFKCELRFWRSSPFYCWAKTIQWLRTREVCEGAVKYEWFSGLVHSLCFVLQQWGVTGHRNPVRQSVLRQHLPGGTNQKGVVFRVVFRQRMSSVQQRQVVSVRPRHVEWRPPLVFALRQRVRERLPLTLR